MKIDKRMEKDCQKLENRIEADFAALKVENDGLRKLVQWNGWTIHGLLSHMGVMEAQMNLLTSQVGGPIVLGSQLGLPFQLRSPPPLTLNQEELDVVEALGRNWEFLNRDVATKGEHTPTGPRYATLEL